MLRHRPFGVGGDVLTEDELILSLCPEARKRDQRRT
jgi:hypothetical protein